MRESASGQGEGETAIRCVCVCMERLSGFIAAKRVKVANGLGLLLPLPLMLQTDKL